MTSRLNVESVEHYQGEPVWIKSSFEVTAGRDPLGIQTITIDRIMPLLAPGILALSRRARYFSFYPFLLDEYERLRLPATMSALSTFIKQREYEFALAVQLCSNGCGQIASGVVGKQRASPATRYKTDAYERGESVESHLGGYGLYYRTPLIEVGIVARIGTPWGPESEPVPLDVLAGDDGKNLAQAFRDAVSDTDYYRNYMTGARPIPLEVIKEYAAHACLCRLVEAPHEQALIRSALFESRLGTAEREVEQRQRSFALFLSLVEEDPEITVLDPVFRDTIRKTFERGDSRSDTHANTLSQWAALIAKEYLQEGLSSIWSQIYRAGLAAQPIDGFSRDELNTLLTQTILDIGEVRLDDTQLPAAPGTPLQDFSDAVIDAARDLSLEELRDWAIEEDTAVAGLALILVLYDRIPDAATVSRGWSQIGHQQSDHQPGLLGFGVSLREHSEGNPTLSQTLAWLGRRYVISAHESIAYSKLPNFTFRFRWEQGRLRFYDLYDINWTRFGLTDIRRDALSRISEDIGMWAKTESGSSLTPVGSEFVGRVLA
jgi:hypothetical protein